ncbi:MAG: hypothetical protein AB7K24_12265 [Gemmataceae bacterium]
MDEARECGPCNHCCSLLGVEELKKPDFARCAHVCTAGCGIYETRPEVCRDYRCLWLAGYLPLEDCRPSELGIMFDCDGNDDDGWDLDVYEIWPGALEQRARIDELIAYISERMKVLRVNYYPYRQPLLMTANGA